MEEVLVLVVPLELCLTMAVAILWRWILGDLLFAIDIRWDVPQVKGHASDVWLQ